MAPGVVVSRASPMNASREPRMVIQPELACWGDERPGSKERPGTMTTTRPVIRADLVAEVRARPTVWNW